MNEVNPSVVLGSSTILNLRQFLLNMRMGKTVQATELEIMMSRAITDIAGLLDYVQLLETKLQSANEEDRGIQSVG